jgi:predicted polyphosphate/ATP-dependent NAD kinase
VNERGEIGFIVNPIAGMGGPLGLKGTDGEAADIARSTDVPAIASQRAEEFLTHLKNRSPVPGIHAWAGKMGQLECVNTEIPHTVHGTPKENTGYEDTVEAVRCLVEEEVDILVIVGGDGTARDVSHGLEGREVPVVGDTAGVKIYSNVYANTPEDAALLVGTFFDRETELQQTVVLDVDEERLREGSLEIREDGTLFVPSLSMYLVGSKSPSLMSEEASKQEISEYVVEELIRDHSVYLVGPGTTTKEILRKVGYRTNVLGIDLLQGTELVQTDMAEQDILDVVSDTCVQLILTPVGGQGFILKRNLPITPRVLRLTDFPENLLMVATPQKLASIPGLKADLDPDLAKRMPRFLRVVIGRDTERMVVFLS